MNDAIAARHRRIRRAVAAATGFVSVALPTAACASEGSSATAASSASGSDTALTSPAARTAQDAGAVDRLAALEAEHGARLGVYAIDTGTGEEVSYRADE